MITLTWNHPNGIGYPNLISTKEFKDLYHLNTEDGLTDFGIAYVKEMERLGIIIDVSHLSDAGFYDVLKYEELRVKNLYDNMRKWALDEEALEEFLVGIKQKEKIFLTLSDEERQLQDVLEETKDWIEITKNTWGFVPIRICRWGIYSDSR